MGAGQSRTAPVTWLFGEAAAVIAEPASPSISDVSLVALTRRDLSVAELRDYLVKRGFDEGDSEFECSRLVDRGLLNDPALAEDLIARLRQRKGLGRAALAAQLRRRKIDPETIALALGGVNDDDLARAVELAQKRILQGGSLDEEKIRRRLGAFLMRKGYSGDVVRAALEEALARRFE